MEKAFTLAVLSEEKKVDYASYFLKGEANYWWESARALEEDEVITWGRFKKIFLEKYLTRYMQTQMELKFFELKQEGMIVGEYQKKFNELARFVGDYVDMDEKREKRFQQGLKPWLQSRVAAFELATYAKVVQKARTFNMNIKDAVQSSEVVAGMLSVNKINAKVRFNYGATRSFISESFVGKLNCEIEQLVEPLSIILDNRERVSVKSICPWCKVEISGYSFPASLIPFQLGEFDVILGMDWLAEHGAQIDCNKKKVILKSPQGKKVEFIGQK
ncbi:uncharacterized protein LOC141695711 [Apium graveolens]|uniref:uncharacterized protein LOC141695711 n=1 Tax=Apium graveolens TaxID=4045 RepID=UPI003D79B6F4